MDLQCSGAATTLRAGQSRVRISLAVRVVTSERCDQLRGPRTPTVNGKRGYISGVERSHRVKLPNHSPPSSAVIKNECSYNSTPSICMSGVNTRNITFAFIHFFTKLQKNVHILNKQFYFSIRFPLPFH